MKMNSRFTSVSLAVFTVAAAPFGFGQATTFSLTFQVDYSLTKGRRFEQTGFTGPFAHRVSPFYVHARASSPAVLTTPDSRTLPLLIPTGLNLFEVTSAFISQSLLDTGFGNGTYRMTGTGIPTVTFNLNGDLYPVTPAITAVNQGAWNSGGVLVVNPASDLTLTINNFTTYGSAGVASQQRLRVFPRSGGIGPVALPRFGEGSPSFDRGVATRSFFFFQPAQSTPIVNITIPAGTMTRGQIYHATLGFGTATTFEDSSLPANGIAASAFESTTEFIMAAQAPGDPTPAPPVFGIQPANRTGVVGGSATFAFSNTGGPATAFQWNLNGVPIDQSNTTKYSTSSDFTQFTINGLSTNDSGSYVLQMYNAGGSAVSVPASLIVVPGTLPPPSIARQPVSVSVAAGGTAVFSVAATTATSSISSYGWKLHGGVLPSNALGATGPTLVLPNVQAAQTGSYDVVVGSSNSSVISATVNLTVLPGSSDQGRLSNLSILTPLAAGESMTMGTVIGGTGTTGTKPLVARFAGPSLQQLGISAFLPDPTMTLVNTSGTSPIIVATNNDWGGGPSLSAAFASVGAFPYSSATSKDAAIFQPSLAPGNYTVVVSDAATGAGTGIAELYDGTPSGAFGLTTPLLLNVSVLKQIAASSSLTAGFVIGGSTSETVLIRFIGPTLSLAPFNIGNAMPDPFLTLMNIGTTPATTVATNNDWGGDPGIAATASLVGAFSVTNTASKDAMLLVTLPPGNYTAIATPAPGTSGGTGIIEVYHVRL